MYAQVAVIVPGISTVFDYHLPEELREDTQVGCLATVPFGKQTVQAVVMRLSSSTEVQETRPIKSLLDSKPILTDLQIRLAGWVAQQTLSPLAECLLLTLPPGLSQHADTLYKMREEQTIAENADLSQTQNRIIQQLKSRG